MIVNINNSNHKLNKEKAIIFYMGLVRKICILPLAGKIKKLKSRLFNDPELRARQIEQFLREQPFEVRKYVQAYTDDIPLTQSLQRNYSSIGEEGSD
jgi:hypothetical protein